jgi:hypothetical protein
MTEIIFSDNTKKAITFLKTLFPAKRVNIVAIDPITENVSAITRPLSAHPAGSPFETVQDREITNFIEMHNGKRNIYYSVNTPIDTAPDGKLKKNHIKEINAVWLDADPAKDKDFTQERERLHKFAKELATSANPPTVITDSGGGIQAFWLLDKPVPVNDATKIEYEALSRGLAEQYGTDKVQNIDRIMRLPYTYNLPTKKKANREITLARSSKINPIRYKSLSFITPAEASDSDSDIDYSKLDMVQVKAPPSKELLDKLDKIRQRNQKVDDLWTDKIDMKPSRSERDFTIAKELKSEGLTLLETAQIMWIFPHGKNKELTRREIVRCYERSGNDFKDSVDQETIDRIAKQVNPLQKAKEAIKKMLSTAQFITLGEATRQNSGTPLFKHFMNRETVNVLFGPSGSGKSFLTLDMAVHLAAGRDWAGFKCKQKMAVLYICTESGSSFGKRAEAARTRIGVKAGATLQECPFAYYPAHVDLLNSKDHIKLIQKLVDDLERLSGYKCGLVIVDTLSAAFGGGNENSEDMTKFVNNMAEIKFSKKTAVLVVHHTGKDESAGARGHSSLKGNIDTEIQVKSEKRGEKYYRSFSSTKQKDDETGNMKKFGLNIIELGKDEDGDAITTCTVILEGEAEFDSLAPSIENELDNDALAAYKAIQFYDAHHDEVEVHYSHTDVQAKCVIYWDLFKSNGVFKKAQDFAEMAVMAIPSKTQMKSFSRACDVLAEKGLVRSGYNGAKYILNSDFDEND